MAKKVIGPLRSETDYNAALDEIEPYFEHAPKPGTPEADRFDLLASVIEDYERKHWPIEPRRRHCTRHGATRGIHRGTLARKASYSAPNVRCSVGSS